MKWTGIINDKPVPESSGPRIEQQVHHPEDNDAQETDEATQEWLQNKSVNILEWLGEEPDSNLMKHLWRDVKMVTHQRSPSKLTERDDLQRRMVENPGCVTPRKAQGCNIYIYKML